LGPRGGRDRHRRWRFAAGDPDAGRGDQYDQRCQLWGNNGSGSGATNYNNAGLYEFVVAKGAVSGGSVPIEGKGSGGGLINTYTNANATTTQGQRRL
jgi:hypothetical protein